MKSVRTKVIALVLCCVFLCSAAIGGASIYTAKQVVEQDSTQIMNLLCEDRTAELNALFGVIEQSVDTLTVFAASQIEEFERFKTEPEYVEEYTRHMMDSAVNAAQNTEGALTVYIRFNPEFTQPQSGLFCSRRGESEEFQPLPPTDLSRYSEAETEYVGWFYQPKAAGKGTWMAPYYNSNIKVDMISYVVPFYIEGEFVGVVGMDIDFDVLADTVEKTSVYRTGYVFLTDSSANIVCHRRLPTGTNLLEYNNGEFRSMAQMLLDTEESGEKLIRYSYEGTAKKASFRSLRNGMRLVLTAPTAEIDQQANQLIWQILIAAVLVLATAVAATLLYTRRLVKPLLELTDAARRITQGDLSVSIVHRSEDEVGVLAESFRLTVQHLNRYITYINELAYRDSLTGVKNKTAYLELIQQMDQLNRLRRPHYGVVVFDINGLKAVNDSRGHDFGDMLIITASKLLSTAFYRSPIYRIGGDEFVVLLEDNDLEHYQELLDTLERELERYNKDPANGLVVSMARGVAIYDESTDLTYSDVFKRADNAMYRNKEETKRRREQEKNSGDEE